MQLQQRRAALRAQRAVPKARSYPVVAPVGGLNTKDALANMPETDAIILDNFFPQPSWVEFRGGHSSLAKFTGQCESLMAYNALGANTSMMYAAVTNGSTRSIYRVDNAGGGTVTVPVVGGSGNTVQAITSSNYDYLQFGSASSAEVLLLLNGVDAPLIYDGSSWSFIAATGSTYTWTAGPNPLSSLRYGAVYKQRIWMIQAGTMNVWYLPQTDFAGALTQLNMGANFKLGGYLVSIVTVSIDNSAGTNDYIAFLANTGEVVMFQGYDPSSVNTWSEAGHFRMGAPVGVGRYCWQQMGMDAAVITVDGVVLMSQALLTDRSQTQQAVSNKIRSGLTQNIQTYGGYLGWQLLLYPGGNKLILNVPTTAARGTSFSYVQNTLTGAWATWGMLQSALNAFCWENFGNSVYYGTNGSVELADQTASISDNGAAIYCSLKPAFNYMGERGKTKTYKQMQAVWSTSGGLNVSVVLNVDFSSTAPSGLPAQSTANQAPWNTSLWNTTYWGDAEQIVRNWLGIAGNGFCAAPYMTVAPNGIIGKLQSFNYMVEDGGVFYGK